MRFLVLNWRDVLSPQAGGSEVHLHEILKRAIEAGHEATLVASHFAGTRDSPEEDEADGVRILRAGNWRLANFSVPWRARKAAKEGQFDLIVDCLTKLPFFAPACFRSTPVLAIVYHLFGSTLFRETGPVSALYCRAFEAAIPMAYRKTPIVAISQSTRADLQSRGFPGEGISVVHCGLDHALYRPIRSVRRDEERPLISVVSRLKRYKCVDHPIRALPRIKEASGARLAIAGGGDDLPRLERLVRRLGLEADVEFLGHVSEREKVELYCRSHLFVNTSHKEGWGLTSIEANACGTPVLAADRPGLRDSVRPETGILVPWGDIDALATSAIALLSDQKRWMTLSRNALAWAARFSWERCAEEMLHYMEQAAAGKRTLEPIEPAFAAEEAFEPVAAEGAKP